MAQINKYMKYIGYSVIVERFRP